MVYEVTVTVKVAAGSAGIAVQRIEKALEAVRNPRDFMDKLHVSVVDKAKECAK